MNVNLNNTYLGFTNNLKPMQAARVEKSLSKLIRYNGVVMSEKEFIYTLLSEGLTPAIEENYSYYSRKLDAMTKPKTDYRLTHPTENYFHHITKTSYDFAQHILNNNFLDAQTHTEYIQQEKLNKEEKERLQHEKELQERLEREEKARIQREKDQAERQEKMKRWTEIGEQLFTNDVEEKLVIILNKYWSKIVEMYPETNRESFYMDMNNKYMQMLGNINYCKHYAKYYLEETENTYTIENNPSRTLEKEFLFSVFNIEMNDQATTVTAKINAFYNGKEYKGSKPVIEQTFYYYNNQEQKFIETEGQKVNIEGYTCYIRKVDNGYIITEGKTGLGLGGAQSNKKIAIEKAKEVVKRAGKEKMDQVVNRNIEKFGISPLYREQVTA